MFSGFYTKMNQQRQICGIRNEIEKVNRVHAKCKRRDLSSQNCKQKRLNLKSKEREREITTLGGGDMT